MGLMLIIFTDFLKTSSFPGYITCFDSLMPWWKEKTRSLCMQFHPTKEHLLADQLMVQTPSSVFLHFYNIMHYQGNGQNSDNAPPLLKWITTIVQTEHTTHFFSANLSRP